MYKIEECTFLWQKMIHLTFVKINTFPNKQQLLSKSLLFQPSHLSVYVSDRASIHVSHLWHFVRLMDIQLCLLETGPYVNKYYHMLIFK